MISVKTHSRITFGVMGAGALYCLGFVIHWSWYHHGPFGTLLGIVGYPFLAFLVWGAIRKAENDPC
jgi:hypothetical protein